MLSLPQTEVINSGGLLSFPISQYTMITGEMSRRLFTSQLQKFIDLTPVAIFLLRIPILEGSIWAAVGPCH